ncbi:MAG: GlcG/HbpS family heme-binding protein [Thiohalorhabdus sp.]|uniref:GlcG/HbpS family heme-binding protein n=1 Tax=Thiohalorhabdus sp. TaxID=3094134 RepID=UPI0039819160
METRNRWKAALTGMAVALLPLPGPSMAQEQDVVSVKRMSMELAQDIAQGAVEACRDEGYQVSAVVVDRGGDTQALLRDVYAPRMTMDIARQKAGAVILSGTSSAQVREGRSDIAADLNHLGEVLTMEGALPVESQGALIGAVSVSGAPGGDIDEECAQSALDGVADRLEFGDM